MWPFRKRGKHESMVQLPSVTLTEEEEQECHALFCSLFPEDPDGGKWYVKNEIADDFHRSWTAFALIVRAQRLLAMGSAEEACSSAAKACAAYPLFIYFYDFACILDKLGKKDEARAMFGECLRRHEVNHVSELDNAILTKRDIKAVLDHARQVLAGPTETQSDQDAAGSTGVVHPDSTTEIAENIYRHLVEELNVHAPDEYNIPIHLRPLFSAKVRLYREAIILFVLRTKAEKDKRYEQLLESFELIVFPRSVDDAGIMKLEAIRAATKDIGQLLPTGRSEETKIMSWSNAWLKSLGCEETNAFVLAKFALDWQQVIINMHDAIEEIGGLPA